MNKCFYRTVSRLGKALGAAILTVSLVLLIIWAAIWLSDSYGSEKVLLGSIGVIFFIMIVGAFYEVFN